MQFKRVYARNLPHWHPEGCALFVTWRLHGSLPASVLEALRRRKWLSAGHRYAFADRQLDTAEAGPLWLKDPRIARATVDALVAGEKQLGFYALHAYVVMADHVHALLTPHVQVARLMRGLKRETAVIANRILARVGRRFWQDESYDHWIRSPAEFGRVKLYIEWNPVKAGLVSRPEDWPWSSASRKT